MGLTSLPGGYVKLNASRPWICYWIVHSLALQDAPLPPATTQAGTMHPHARSECALLLNMLAAGCLMAHGLAAVSWQAHLACLVQPHKRKACCLP